MKKKQTYFFCPECRKKLEQLDYKPFCSERCKTKDLAKWSDGSYKFIGENASTQLDDESD